MQTMERVPSWAYRVLMDNKRAIEEMKKRLEVIETRIKALEPTEEKLIRLAMVAMFD